MWQQLFGLYLVCALDSRRRAGIGTEHLNNCVPNCGGQAESKFANYPVQISLTGSYLAAQDVAFAYAKITLTYQAARPLLHIEVNGKWEYTHPASWSPVLPERQASPTETRCQAGQPCGDGWP